MLAGSHIQPTLVIRHELLHDQTHLIFYKRKIQATFPTLLFMSYIDSQLRFSPSLPNRCYPRFCLLFVLLPPSRGFSSHVETHTISKSFIETGFYSLLVVRLTSYHRNSLFRRLSSPLQLSCAFLFTEEISSGRWNRYERKRDDWIGVRECSWHSSKRSIARSPFRRSNRWSVWKYGLAITCLGNGKR